MAAQPTLRLRSPQRHAESPPGPPSSSTHSSIVPRREGAPAWRVSFLLTLSAAAITLFLLLASSLLPPSPAALRSAAVAFKLSHPAPAAASALDRVGDSFLSKMASKTPYAARPLGFLSGAAAHSHSAAGAGGRAVCRARHVSLVARHGSRWLTKDKHLLLMRDAVAAAVVWDTVKSPSTGSHTGMSRAVFEAAVADARVGLLQEGYSLAPARVAHPWLPPPRSATQSTATAAAAAAAAAASTAAAAHRAPRERALLIAPAAAAKRLFASFSPLHSSLLTPLGRAELASLGSRLAARLPPDLFLDGQVTVGATDKARTAESAEAFMRGLQGGLQSALTVATATATATGSDTAAGRTKAGVAAKRHLE